MDDALEPEPLNLTEAAVDLVPEEVFLFPEELVETDDMLPVVFVTFSAIFVSASFSELESDR